MTRVAFGLEKASSSWRDLAREPLSVEGRKSRFGRGGKSFDRKILVDEFGNTHDCREILAIATDNGDVAGFLFGNIPDEIIKKWF